jgi:LysR family transcriptional regulator, transcriptional activator for bauABCD operon
MEAQEILILSGCFIGFLPAHRGGARVMRGTMRAIRPLAWRLTSRFSAVHEPNAGSQVLKHHLVNLLRQEKCKVYSQ